MQRHRRPGKSRPAEQGKRLLSDSTPQVAYSATWKAKDRGSQGYIFREDRRPRYFKSRGSNGGPHFGQTVIKDTKHGGDVMVMYSHHRPEFHRYRRIRRPMQNGGQPGLLHEPKAAPQAAKSPQTKLSTQPMHVAHPQNGRDASRETLEPSQAGYLGGFVFHRLEGKSPAQTQRSNDFKATGSEKDFSRQLHGDNGVVFPRGPETGLRPKHQSSSTNLLDRPSGSGWAKSEESEGDRLQRRRSSHQLTPYSLDVMHNVQHLLSPLNQHTPHKRRTLEGPPIRTVSFQGKDRGIEPTLLFPNTRNEQPPRLQKDAQPGVKLISSLENIQVHRPAKLQTTQLSESKAKTISRQQQLLPRTSETLSWKISQSELKGGNILHLKLPPSQSNSAIHPPPISQSSKSHPSSPPPALPPNHHHQPDPLTPNPALKTPPHASSPSRQSHPSAKPLHLPPEFLAFALSSSSSSGLRDSSYNPRTPDHNFSSGASNTEPRRSAAGVEGHGGGYQEGDSGSDNRGSRPGERRGLLVFEATSVREREREEGRRASWRR
ncbi:hypothetical protein MMC10_008304 [Thelotrema lepadinum]|nr:hypothetical protein [Thelotrema lepadinum]